MKLTNEELLGMKQNKGRRNELKQLKFLKRLKNLQLTNKEGNFYAYKSHGAPCSCWMCSNAKYKRSKEKINKIKTIDNDLQNGE